MRVIYFLDSLIEIVFAAASQNKNYVFSCEHIVTCIQGRGHRKKMSGVGWGGGGDGLIQS